MAEMAKIDMIIETLKRQGPPRGWAEEQLRFNPDLARHLLNEYMSQLVWDTYQRTRETLRG